LNTNFGFFAASSRFPKKLYGFIMEHFYLNLVRLHDYYLLKF